MLSNFEMDCIIKFLNKSYYICDDSFIRKDGKAIIFGESIENELIKIFCFDRYSIKSMLKSWGIFNGLDYKNFDRKYYLMKSTIPLLDIDDIQLPAPDMIKYINFHQQMIYEIVGIPKMLFGFNDIMGSCYKIIEPSY